MAIEHGISDWHTLRPVLAQLQWGDGLTREEMKNQSPELRTAVTELLPANYRFADAGSVCSYFEQLEREGRFDLADREPPRGYADQSTTGLTVPGNRYPPSIGGGYGSGNTGSSAQTGTGRWGTSERDHWK